ncbi:MAG: TRAP transporter substrate-binding protein [Desulfobacterota bacterium]|nr:TRAP transporter substrate-binding protein [Thermodesulfobacteriota bacterium]MDW8002590.1 TRAP transporter substrate-binding protein [Deltaproteobacteria bacterium]
MKKLLIAALAFAVIFTFYVPKGFAQHKVTLSFAHFWPATHYIHVHQFPRYFKMVEEATKGKYVLDIKWYPAESLLKAADLIGGVEKGIADTGTASFGYNPGKFPVMLTLTQPGIAPPNSSDAAAHAGWEFYKIMRPKELDTVKILYVYATGPGWLHSNKPITRIDQLKGMKIRVTGAGVLGVRAVGGEPVAMPMSEVYLAASKGIIDALVSPAETLEGWKHAEVFKYSTFMPYFYSEYFWVAMNLDKWKSLPKDLQDAFESVAEAAMKEAGQIWQYQQQRGIEFAKKKPGGHEFLTLPDAEVKKLAELLKPVETEYAKSLREKGLDADRIIKTAKDLVEKYNKLTYPVWKP